TCKGELTPDLEWRAFGRVDGDVGAKLRRQLPPVAVEVRDDDRVDGAARERDDGREPDRTGADDDGDLSRCDLRTADVELPDRERVHERDRIGGHILGAGPGHRLGYE